MFKRSKPGSKILFLYANRPCIVIGRNQNPWVEVNLSLLKESGRTNQPTQSALAVKGLAENGTIDLIRRRSGGGTVFHDGGNVNWSFICDMPEFTRDKHAELVVRALRKLGVARARVNERHDIVLDQGRSQKPVDSEDTHQTPWTTMDNSSPRPLKVSGSAYKLARNRALHHGTALLNSPNLEVISRFLRSPAKKFITAKGVESVSSPVGNIGVTRADFDDAILKEYAATYKADLAFEVVGSMDDIDIDEIRKDYEELQVSNTGSGQSPY